MYITNFILNKFLYLVSLLFSSHRHQYNQLRPRGGMQNDRYIYILYFKIMIMICVIVFYKLYRFASLTTASITAPKPPAGFGHGIHAGGRGSSGSCIGGGIGRLPAAGGSPAGGIGGVKGSGVRGRISSSDSTCSRKRAPISSPAPISSAAG